MPKKIADFLAYWWFTLLPTFGAWWIADWIEPDDFIVQFGIYLLLGIMFIVAKDRLGISGFLKSKGETCQEK